MIAMATAMVALQIISANETYIFSDVNRIKRRFFVIVRQNVSFDEARERCRQKEVHKGYKLVLARLDEDEELKLVTDYMNLRERLWVNAKAACNTGCVYNCDEGIENCEVKDSTYGRQWDYIWVHTYRRTKIQSKLQKIGKFHGDELKKYMRHGVGMGKTGNGICGTCPEYGTYIGIYKGTSEVGEGDLTFSNYKNEEKMGFICEFFGLPTHKGGNQFASEMADEQ